MPDMQLLKNTELKMKLTQEINILVQGEERETLESIHNNFNLHKKVAGIYRPKISGRLTRKTDEFILEKSSELMHGKTILKLISKPKKVTSSLKHTILDHIS